MIDFLNKIKRYWMKLRLQPIRVFCFHQVSEVFDADHMWEGDWISTKDFKQRIGMLKEDGNIFITLPEAYQHVCNDIFRFRKYAVLTADDGDMTVCDIIPWLVEKHIPITLFVCSAFVEGEQRKGKPRPMMLKSDLDQLIARYPQLITIGNHSVRHEMSTSLSAEDFADDVKQSEFGLKRLANKIPYYAYPNGNSSTSTDIYLQSQKLIPVYCDGRVNYNEERVIHRELLK